MGALLAMGIVGLVASGIYLKWFYRPTQAGPWTDIQAVRASVTTGLAVRRVHRWLSWLVSIGLVIYLVLWARITVRPHAMVRRRMLAVALVLLLVGFFGPSVVVWSGRPRNLLHRWYLVHEAPGYVLLGAVLLAALAGLRVRRADSPTMLEVPSKAKPWRLGRSSRVGDAPRTRR